jgi:two-component system response regulator RegA
MAIKHSRSVLIVEDDDALAGYLGSAVRDNGFQVERAQDKVSALRVLAQPDPPELVILDLGLPPAASTMNEGLAVLDSWLAQQPWAKIIVLTGQDEQAAAQEAIRRGAFDFLVKPAALPQILQALYRASLFATEEARMTADGETRLHLTARLDEGPREAAAAAEEQLLRRTLAETGHNIAETGRRLGLAREHVYYYLKKYGIHRPD